MHVEWEAWQVVCQELNKLDIDVNKEDMLNAAITVWAEELVELRVHQTPEIRATALEDKRKNFDFYSAGGD
jgi:hypothetical protein